MSRITKVSVSQDCKVPELRKLVKIISEYDALQKKHDIVDDEAYAECILQMRNLTEQCCTYSLFGKNIPGIDNTLMGYILGYVNFDECENVFQVLTYCGLCSTYGNYNKLLNKKLMNAAKYFVAKQSPYSLYYYDCLLKTILQYKNKGITDLQQILVMAVPIAQRYMMRMFIVDVFTFYKKYMNAISDTGAMGVDDFHRNERVLVDFEDFVIPSFSLKESIKSAKIYRYKMTKYKMLLNRYRLAYAS
jgi:hypothetical protein